MYTVYSLELLGKDVREMPNLTGDSNENVQYSMGYSRIPLSWNTSWIIV